MAGNIQHVITQTHLKNYNVTSKQLLSSYSHANVCVCKCKKNIYDKKYTEIFLKK